jgi:hypothetical protein
VDARGGGRDSNAQLAVVLLQIGAEALALAGPGRRDAAAAQLRGWLAAPVTGAEAGGDEQLGYALVLALLTLGAGEWRALYPVFLRAACAAAAAQAGADGTRKGSLGDDEARWALCRPYLAWVGLFDQLHRLAVPTKPAPTAGVPIPGRATPPAAPAPRDRDGLEGLLARLRDLPHAMGRARELSEWLGDVLTAGDASEGLDVLEAYAVLEPGQTPAEWLRAAVG